MKEYTIRPMILALLWGGCLQAADWTHYLGPTGNMRSAETGINKNWGEKPPAELWRVDLHDSKGGFSGPAIADGILYILDHDGGQDIVLALKAKTGEEIWRFVYPQAKPDNYGYTRSTPTVEAGRVYSVTRGGVVYCLDAKMGKELWRTDTTALVGGEPAEWGIASSAFIDGDRLIAIGAGENKHIVALDKADGTLLWSGGGTHPAGYATPMVATLGGRRQYLVFTGDSLIGVDAGAGTLLWRHPWETRLGCNAGTPVVVGENRVWIGSGYKSGCTLLEIDGGEVKEVWKAKLPSPPWGSAVFDDGHLYAAGLPGYLICLDAQSGQEKWRDKGTGRGFENGSMCAVDGTLILMEGNTGTVVQVELSSEAYRELGRTSPLGKSRNCWVAPVVANKLLYVRSPKELVCLNLE